MARDAILQIRRDIESGWVNSNPVLRSGEFGYETDTNRLKVGDGSTTWTALEYVTGGSYSVSAEPPDNPQTGSVWFNAENGRTYIYYDSYWVEIGGDPGPQGPDNLIISDTAPENRDVLWYDTSEPGDAVLPVGGTTGQVLVKLSNDDYDVGWATI